MASKEKWSLDLSNRGRWLAWNRRDTVIEVNEVKKVRNHRTVERLIVYGVASSLSNANFSIWIKVDSCGCAEGVFQGSKSTKLY